MSCELYHSNESFRLESGVVLPGLEIAYHTFGRLSPRGFRSDRLVGWSGW